MGTVELEREFQPQALREIERSLRAKLRAHHVSEPFIERCSEDALQRGLIEYFRALEQGKQIENRDAFVVTAAFFRAIDELRREARRLDGTALDQILDSGRSASPPTEEVAVEYLQAAELREALKGLSAEERQVLSLHYFEELSAAESAKALFCSERTYRRRLKGALEKLGRLLGAPASEPGSELAIEIGVVLWVGLRGARVVLSQSPLEQALALPGAARDGALWLGARARDLIARIAGGDTSERVAALAGGPAGKAAGACVAACLLTTGGVVLIGGEGSHHAERPAQRSAEKPARPAPPVSVHSPPESSTPKEESRNQGKREHAQPRSSPAERAKQREREATEAVATQQPESAVAGSGEESAPEPSSAPSSPPPSATSPTEIANDQFGP